MNTDKIDEGDPEIKRQIIPNDKKQRKVKRQLKTTTPKNWTEWKCPRCGFPPQDMLALDGGSRPCSNKKCRTHFHWCESKQEYSTIPPIRCHIMDFSMHSEKKKRKEEKEISSSLLSTISFAPSGRSPSYGELKSVPLMVEEQGLVNYSHISCPYCKDTIDFHQNAYDINARHKEDGSGKGILVTNADCLEEGEVKITTYETTFRSIGNRDSISIKFECGTCVGNPVLTIMQHKGNTLAFFTKEK